MAMYNVKIYRSRLACFTCHPALPFVAFTVAMFPSALVDTFGQVWTCSTAECTDKACSARTLSAVTNTRPISNDSSNQFFELTGHRGGGYDRYWPNGAVLNVGFYDWDHSVDGVTRDPDFDDWLHQLQREVLEDAKEWSAYANIQFRIAPVEQSDIRISFQNSRYSSWIGTDALDIEGEPTMNLGVIDPERPHIAWPVPRHVVLHEFGHALGFTHEQFHPDANIPWDHDSVYEYYEEKYGWSKEKVDRNVLSPPVTQSVTTYDPLSIMHYDVLNRLTIGDFELSQNETLSSRDKLGVNLIYPKGGAYSQRVSYSGISSWKSFIFNWYQTSQLQYGDFYGDGVVDMFYADGFNWWISDDSKTSWKRLGTSKYQGETLRLGDFNGDGITDVFVANGSTWQISWSGTSGWEKVGNSGYRTSDLAFADFNGDNQTDIFIGNGSAWHVSWSGRSGWEKLGNSQYKTSDLAFADLNGDGEDDIFIGDGSAWHVSWSGRSGWEKLGNSQYRTSDLAFGDFDGDGRDDVFIGNGTTWQISYGAKSGWQILNHSKYKNNALRFEDINGDGRTDVIREVRINSEHDLFIEDAPLDLEDFRGFSNDQATTASGGLYSVTPTEITRVSNSTTITWKSINSNQLAEVQHSTDLLNWVPIAVVAGASSYKDDEANRASLLQGYYRVLIYRE